MTLPYYASAEQIMRDRSELARKGIARGRSVVVLTFADGVLFVAENPSTALHKVSELYDRLGFAAVGKYNEFENLRRAGIVHADMRGYSYDRRDVTGRSLANGYAQTLGTIFTEQPKPYEVEICVAEIGPYGAPPQGQLYRITYDGSIVDEQKFVVMGGATEPIVKALNESYRSGLDLAEAVAVAVNALQDGTSSGNGDAERRTLGVSGLEVAVLDQARPRRAFRRIAGAALEALLPAPPSGSAEKADPAETPDDGKAAGADGDSSA
ncbi:proteasome subunit alpha [Rhodococcus sp. ABRD24]|uniref:proteasome subunit alpha n=1 Tax=Rhodococcus sp. ABRD24 TaxID=2507582 RepID=UPI00103E7814|nr:proteasome subunit alpha [Rhodococcus sp. ABRD24]QBJ94549.1 proteasome subunit alpha [Rhodococcus sp. ABRD24]